METYWEVLIIWVKRSNLRFKRVVLSKNWVWPLGDIWQRLETFLLDTIGNKGSDIYWEEARLLHILRQRIIQSKTSIVLRLGTPVLKESLWLLCWEKGSLEEGGKPVRRLVPQSKWERIQLGLKHCSESGEKWSDSGSTLKAESMGLLRD